MRRIVKQQNKRRLSQVGLWIRCKGSRASTKLVQSQLDYAGLLEINGLHKCWSFGVTGLGRYQCYTGNEGGIIYYGQLLQAARDLKASFSLLGLRFSVLLNDKVAQNIIKPCFAPLHFRKYVHTYRNIPMLAMLSWSQRGSRPLIVASSMFQGTNLFSRRNPAENRQQAVLIVHRGN